MQGRTHEKENIPADIHTQVTVARCSSSCTRAKYNSAGRRFCVFVLLNIAIINEGLCMHVCCFFASLNNCSSCLLHSGCAYSGPPNSLDKQSSYLFYLGLVASGWVNFTTVYKSCHSNPSLLARHVQ